MDKKVLKVYACPMSARLSKGLTDIPRETHTYDDNYIWSVIIQYIEKLLILH